MYTKTEIIIITKIIIIRHSLTQCILYPPTKREWNYDGSNSLVEQCKHYCVGLIKSKKNKITTITTKTTLKAKTPAPTITCNSRNKKNSQSTQNFLSFPLSLSQRWEKIELKPFLDLRTKSRYMVQIVHGTIQLKAAIWIALIVAWMKCIFHSLIYFSQSDHQHTSLLLSLPHSHFEL